MFAHTRSTLYSNREGRAGQDKDTWLLRGCIDCRAGRLLEVDWQESGGWRKC